MGPVPPEGNAGNPAFLLDYLSDCFLDYFIWIASLIPPPWDGARNDALQRERH